MAKLTRAEKATQRITAAAHLLMAAGYQPDGETAQETARVPTMASPVFGVGGGELRTFGGRTRFALPGTDRKATVGPLTTCFYRVVNGKATDFHNTATSDLDEVRDAIERAKQ